jgi:wobble nucleotide-excising tRNase
LTFFHRFAWNEEVQEIIPILSLMRKKNNEMESEISNSDEEIEA